MKCKKQKLKWEDVYQLPLWYDDVTYAFSKNNVMTLDFDDCVTNEQAKKIISLINRETECKGVVKANCISLVAHIDNELIPFDIRGWGYLRGKLNLSIKKSERIQDDFIKYIINKIEGN